MTGYYIVEFDSSENTDPAYIPGLDKALGYDNCGYEFASLANAQHLHIISKPCDSKKFNS